MRPIEDLRRVLRTMGNELRGGGLSPQRLDFLLALAAEHLDEVEIVIDGDRPSRGPFRVIEGDRS